MGKYVLKRGTHVTGQGLTAKRYSAKDPAANVIESDTDLASFDPLKFERWREPVEPSPVLPPLVVQEPPAARLGASAAAPVAVKAVPPSPVVASTIPPVAQPGVREELDKMSIEELKSKAIDEEIDLKGASSKEAIIRAIRRASKG